MRFLHTSDWHIGKQLRTHKRDEEYIAALDEVFDIAVDRDVDCVLVAGDIYDAAVPTPDAERIVFRFFAQLVGAGIPAVVIAGNHDHPRRWDAHGPLFNHLGISVIGEPLSAEEGGVIKVKSRDESETAVIAALPWVSERRVRDFENLMQEGTHKQEYADGVANMMNHLAASFEDNTVNILLAHVLIEDAKVGGPETGERELHMGHTYVIKRQRLPSTAQYIALGHVHNPDQPKGFQLNNAWYCGSLLQCDFGESGQSKGVNIVDVSAGKKAKVEAVPLASIRHLRNVGGHKAGHTLEELKAMDPPDANSYVKVFVKVDRPLSGLAEQVREIIPNAVSIEVQRSDEDAPEEVSQTRGMTPTQLFEAYHQSQYNAEAAPELLALFNRLHEEATSAPD
jgi:exonuclease SbcD